MRGGSDGTSKGVHTGTGARWSPSCHRSSRNKAERDTADVTVVRLNSRRETTNERFNPVRKKGSSARPPAQCQGEQCVQGGERAREKERERKSGRERESVKGERIRRNLSHFSLSLSLSPTPSSRFSALADVYRIVASACLCSASADRAAMVYSTRSER